MNECRQLAANILALAKAAGAEEAVALSAGAGAFGPSLQEAGAKIQPEHNARLYVCLWGETIPPRILERHIDVLSVAKNGNNKNLAVRSFWEGMNQAEAQNLGTEQALRDYFKPLGYRETAAMDMADPAQQQTPENQIGRYIAWCKEQTNPTANSAWLLRLFRWGQEAPQPSVSGPFLTVLTRTQGRREDGLTEVMLCLAAQTDRDFEWLVVGHRLSEPEHAMVERVLASAPPYLQERIRFCPCEEEGRTAPLNFGFSVARGQYVAVLDDDDVVMDNYVEVFHKASRQSEGAILHAYSIKQDWQNVSISYREGNSLRAISNYDFKYCRPYNFLDQLTVNYCPLMSMAIPVRPFHEWKIRFDEELSMTEDWDYHTRLAALTGVTDIAEITSIYRWWKNAETSATLYSQKEWAKTYQVLTERFSHLFFPVHVKDLNAAASLSASIPLELFAKEDGVFSAKTMRSCDGRMDGSCREFLFSDLPQGLYQGLLRIDPGYFGGILIDELKIVVTLHGGERITYGMDDVTSNGWRINGTWAFIQDDPQIYFQIPGGQSAQTIQVSYTGPAYMSAVEAKCIEEAFACTSAQLTVEAEGCNGPVPAKTVCSGNQVECIYDLKSLGKISRLEFSPCLRGSVITQKMRIKATGAGQEEIPLHWKHNGIYRPDAAIFLRRPYYRARCGKPIETLTIEFRIDGEISDGAALSIQNPVKYILKKLLGLLRRRAL